MAKKWDGIDDFHEPFTKNSDPFCFFFRLMQYSIRGTLVYILFIVVLIRTRFDLTFFFFLAIYLARPLLFFSFSSPKTALFVFSSERFNETPNIQISHHARARKRKRKKKRGI